VPQQLAGGDVGDVADIGEQDRVVAHQWVVDATPKSTNIRSTAYLAAK
jgi:hypothetical protein